MFKRISIFLIVLLTVLAFTFGASAVAPGLFIEKDASNTYIDYVDAEGTSIMLIDDTDGVTIAVEIIGSVYTSMTITSATDASDLTTASLVTAGGAAIAKQLYLGDDLDMSVNGTGTYDITLKTNMADALSITDGTDIIVFNTTTGTPVVTITPITTITGLLTAGGGITVGVSDDGETVTFYGDNVGSNFVWAEAGDSNVGTLTLGASTDYVDFTAYGATASTYLRWDGSEDDLLLVGTETQLVIAGTTDATSYVDGSLRTAGGLGVAKAAYIKGLLEVGVNAAGTDFKVFGVTTGYLVWWDASADTNKGTLYIGANTKGVDVFMYGNTTGKYVKWDQSADDLLLVGAGLVFSETQADEVITIGGTYDHGIRFTEDMVSGDVTNSFINIGDYTTGIAVAPSGANMFGVVQNVTLNVNVAYWYQAYYTKITTSGTTTDTSIVGHALRLVIGSNLAAVYGIQSHVIISGARTFTGEVTAGSFYLDVGSTTISNAGSKVNAFQAILIGSSTVTSSYFTIASFTATTNTNTDALVFIGQDSTGTTDTVIEFDLDGTVANVWEFNGTVSDAFTATDAGATDIDSQDRYVLIPVKVEGVTEQLYIIAAETWN